MARLIDSLPSFAAVWERLVRQKAEGRMPHALGFSGPSVAEKVEMAWAFAQLMTCENDEPNKPKPCGQCGACRRIETRESEAVFFVAPEKNTIKLEAAHHILEFLSLQKVSRARIVIVDQAHLLSVQTANALLKSVEEPPPDTYFILITPEFSQLLSTLRSRLQSIRFAPQSFVADPELDEVRSLVRQFLSEIKQGRREALEQIQSEAKDKEMALQVMRLIQRELRDWTAAHTDLPAEQLRRHMDLWQTAFRVELDVLANVDRPLLLENFFHRARAALG